MKIHKIDYKDVPAISFKDLSYIQLADFLSDFYSYTPEIDSFAEVIVDRKNKPVNRALLVSELKNVYTNFDASTAQKANIEALSSENTFTIITAHQPSLFGGPLYYILKVCSVINLTRQLSNAYPGYTFVPTFISGGEDHDFDEVDHAHVYGKNVQWKRDASGSVGRLDLSNLDDSIEELSDILGSHPIAMKMIEIFRQAKENSSTYGEFVFQWVNTLFAEYGLLLINMDNAPMKQNFSPIIEKELLEQTSQSIVQATQEKLENHKFKAQAFPRDINLFYLGLGGRDRIEKAGDRYEIVNTDTSFSQEEILEELKNHPEHFSPNVVMRPLYQEYTLPNLAYVGGGGEIAYWLERKSQFEAFGIFYPMLIRRNSAMVVNKGMKKNITKLDLSISQIFTEEHALINHYIEQNTTIDISLEDEKKEIEAAFDKIATKSKQADPTLAKSVLSEMTKQLKSIDQMESRIKRAIKSQEEVNVNKISKLKEKLFPNNGLQERYDNFIPHYMSVGEDFFDLLIEHLDPMDRRFVCFVEE